NVGDGLVDLRTVVRGMKQEAPSSPSGREGVVHGSISYNSIKNELLKNDVQQHLRLLPSENPRSP
ncbi:hypothetical protein, partial [Methanosarcina sp. 1.H.T.1A.1]